MGDKETVKEKDFIEVEYTGMLKEDSIVFDTTDAKTAKENEIYNEQMSYGPIVICVGEGHILKGLDENLIGKEVGMEYTIPLSPEKGFGKKSAKMIQLIATSKFHKENIEPQPGLQVNVDGTIGVVKTVTGGRTLVDFNHPLSGKELVYKVKINKKLADDSEKAKALVEQHMGLKDCELNVETGALKIAYKIELPKDIQKKIEEKIIALIPSIKKVEFTVQDKEKKEVEKKE